MAARVAPRAESASMRSARPDFSTPHRGPWPRIAFGCLARSASASASAPPFEDEVAGESAEPRPDEEADRVDMRELRDERSLFASRPELIHHRERAGDCPDHCSLLDGLGRDGSIERVLVVRVFGETLFDEVERVRVEPEIAQCFDDGRLDRVLVHVLS